MHSIELLLDEASDAAVRAEWRVLAEAGLPSQADHGSASNAPHVTLAARPGFEASADPRLRVLSALLPFEAELGALLVFGAPPRGLVLVRPVVPSLRLLDLHRQVHETLGGSGDAVHSTPGRWTPHVTLGSRLGPEQLARAVEVLDGHGAPASRPVLLTGLRRWDPSRREIVGLGPSRAEE